jgi:hypothetical protein
MGFMLLNIVLRTSNVIEDWAREYFIRKKKERKTKIWKTKQKCKERR